jgi:hypothetical protein
LSRFREQENGRRREPAAPFAQILAFSMLRAAFLLMGRNAARRHNPDKSRSIVNVREEASIEGEEFLVNGSEVIFPACLARMHAMRLKYPSDPPDGFVVFDFAAKEVGRRFPFTRD